jgi:hypothetical protein
MQPPTDLFFFVFKRKNGIQIEPIERQEYMNIRLRSQWREAHSDSQLYSAHMVYNRLDVPADDAIGAYIQWTFDELPDAFTHGRGRSETDPGSSRRAGRTSIPFSTRFGTTAPKSLPTISTT